MTIGDDSFAGGLFSLGYGREKGNSVLAILEELGQVGLVLYVLLLLYIFHPIWRAARRATDRDDSVLLYLILGTLVGLTANSMFEAWWVAPGSPASPYFWAMTGIGMAVSERVAASARRVVVSRPTRAPTLAVQSHRPMPSARRLAKSI